MIGIAKAPASCGELVQGTLNGESFHISCPIDLYSQVRVVLNGKGEPCPSKEERGKVVGPPDKWHVKPRYNIGATCLPRGPKGFTGWKTKEAIKKTLKFLGKKNLGAHFEIDSKIPLGKGMASSTADIGAASLATASALKKEISPQEIIRIALSIEPTDGTLFNGIVIFDHRNGALFKFLGKAPDMEILVIDLGGEVDTLEFNKKDLIKINQEREGEIKEALKLVEKGIKRKNPGLIAKGATISAFSNQRILYKPALDRIWKIAQEAGALGINVAHSGTVVGVLAEPSKVNFKELKNSLQGRGIGKVFYKTKIVNDGLQII
jgi:L-threonine kinase